MTESSKLYVLLTERTKRAAMEHNWILVRALAGALAELDVTAAMQQAGHVAWNAYTSVMPVIGQPNKRKHMTCIDVTTIDQEPRSQWVCGPDCPNSHAPQTCATCGQPVRWYDAQRDPGDGTLVRPGMWAHFADSVLGADHEVTLSL